MQSLIINLQRIIPVLPPPIHDLSQDLLNSSSLDQSTAEILANLWKGLQESFPNEILTLIDCMFFSLYLNYL